jgi:septal ring factor EnvC (AmiA/AmiB activator)
VARASHLILLAALALAAGPGISLAAPNPEDAKREELERVQRQLEEGRLRQNELEQNAIALGKEVEDLRAQLVLAGQSARDKETTLSTLEQQMAALETDAKGKREALGRRRAEIVELSSALQRLAVHPPEAMLVLPQPPTDTVRSALVLASTMPSLAARASALRAELEELAQVEDSIRKQRDQIANTAGTLGEQRHQIEALLKRKSQLERQAIDETAQVGVKVAQLAASAEDLHQLIEKLTAERERQEKLRQEAEAKARAEAAAAQTVPAIRPPSGPPVGEAVLNLGGDRTLPAAGKILLAYGQDNEFGVTARGITIETRTEATVVAPAAGHVLFAGPFRGYGQILIIEHGDGYHSLTAGLGRIDAQVGAAVAAGEPIGAMAPSNGRNPTLYFELRRSGQPLNPQPWLTARGK